MGDPLDSPRPPAPLNFLGRGPYSFDHIYITPTLGRRLSVLFKIILDDSTTKHANLWELYLHRTVPRKLNQFFGHPGHFHNPTFQLHAHVFELEKEQGGECNAKGRWRMAQWLQEIGLRRRRPIKRVFGEAEGRETHILVPVDVARQPPTHSVEPESLD